MIAAAVVTIFERPRKTCSGCVHWSAYNHRSEKGYVEAMCQQNADDRKHELKRASDFCSKWKRSGAVA